VIECDRLDIEEINKILAMQRGLRENNRSSHILECLKNRCTGIFERHAKNLPVKVGQIPMTNSDKQDPLKLLHRLSFVHEFDQSVCIDEESC
jgi:hypothetical protein